MKKANLLSILTILVLVPVTLLLGSRLKGRAYYLTSTLIVVEIMLPFFMRFESRRPKPRELVILAVMAALAAVSRAAFAFSPHLKTVTGLVMITGIAFGAEAGFLTGAVAAFASNFFFGQGPWTPWQMFAFGVAGFVAGVLFHSRKRWQNPWILAAFGFFSSVVLIGPLLDSCTVFTVLTKFTKKNILLIYSQGLPVNIAQGIGAALTLLVLSGPLLAKLDRLKTKYGMLET